MYSLKGTPINVIYIYILNMMWINIIAIPNCILNINITINYRIFSWTLEVYTLYVDIRS